ncbi:hypothetical protein CRM22_007486 [Opisthorchis felineus]|uniref:L-type lectin-like domain-containing protein n=1 Tax=Opisthorchis felineus TaxID=147828 RepID=A0A4S2LP04_OPIFE|nr:hypothetical protein CRM22_007486 [Opisthorchis felineus]
MLVVFLAILSHLSGILTYSSFEKREQSLALPHHTFGWFSYGSAVFEPDHVRLTQDVRSQTGGLQCTAPMMYRDWEIHLTFHVHSPAKTLVGDGFAFWYTEQPISMGSAFGSREVFRGLGIFFDTYANQNGAHSHEHPYISAMVSDGKNAYDHDKDGTLTELAGCSTDFRNHERTKAIIRFVRDQLSLKLFYPDVQREVECFSVDGVHLPIGYYLGVSAATGDLSDTHDIVSIKTFEVDAERTPEELSIDAAQIEPSSGHAAPPRPRVPDDPSPSRLIRWIGKAFLLLSILGALGTCGYFGYRHYTRGRRHVKRLY